jgi:hypothetical protein
MRARPLQLTAASALLERSTQDVAGGASAVESINACRALSALLLKGHGPAASVPADAAGASGAHDSELGY